MSCIGCYFCACTGYEDYPHNAIPCRVKGHREWADREVELAWAALPREKEAPYACPYCGSETTCKHWKGTGWSKDA